MRLKLICKVCNDAGHTRMWELSSHAFSDSALRNQQEILNKYFKLFVSRLKSRIDADASHAVVIDMSKWYNFLTLDMIGDLCFDASFGALEYGKYHICMANLVGGIKYARSLSIASSYEPFMTIPNMIVMLVPSIARLELRLSLQSSVLARPSLC